MFKKIENFIEFLNAHNFEYHQIVIEKINNSIYVCIHEISHNDYVYEDLAFFCQQAKNEFELKTCYAKHSAKYSCYNLHFSFFC